MSIFKDLTDKVAKEDSVTHPAAATGWPVDVKEVLLQQLTDPSFRSMNGMNLNDPSDLGKLLGDSGKSGIGVMVKDPTSKKAQLLVNPKMAGSLNSGPGGQTIPKNSMADPNVTAHFDLVYHGANNTAPVIYSYSEMHRGDPAEGSGNYMGPNLPRQNMAVPNMPPQDSPTTNKSKLESDQIGTVGMFDESVRPVTMGDFANQKNLPLGKSGVEAARVNQFFLGSKIPPNIDATGKQTPTPGNDGLGVIGNNLRTGTTIFKSIRGGAGFFNDLIRGPSN